MNERILELARQSGGIDMTNHTAGITTWVGTSTPEFLERFAELIVRECIVDFYRRYLDTTSGEDITQQVDRYVKDHFGVGE